MNNKFIKQLIKEIQDESTSIAEDAVSSAEFTGFIDTGSYMFNAQLSGSIYGGMPNTKCLCLAGEQAVGKTFFALGMVGNFLQLNPEAIVIWYLAEPAVTKKMLLDRAIDPNRVIFAEPVTVFEWRHHVIKTLNAYLENAEKERPLMMMVLDSLGALSTEKELEDSTKGTDKRDMTRQQHIRGTFRIIDKKLAKSKVPMIVTNHTYQTMDMYSPAEISGGGGIKYASDLVVTLSASKDRDGVQSGPVVGNIIKVRMFKNRIAKQHTVIEVRLSYETGLDRYYGLLDLGEKYNIFKKVANKYEFPDGTKAFGKAIYKNPEKFFTPEILDLLEEAAQTEYNYGKGSLSEDADAEADITEPTPQ